jgi:oxygen-dependent protoporphyrinogen oxidase
MSARRVVVVGAGPAGLAAARRLAASGCEVRVLERQRRAGGRVAGEDKEGFPCEPGGHLLSSADVRLAQLLSEAGAPDALLPLRSAAEGQLRGGWVHEARGSGWRALARLPGVGFWHARRLLRLPRLLRRYAPNLDREAPERAAPHDDRSAADFARLYLGEALYARWVAALVACDALADPEQASRVLFLLGLAAPPDAVPALFRGGAGSVGPRLAEGLDVRLGAEAVAVESAGAGGALVRFRADELEGTAGADAVVIAPPAPVAAALADSLLTPAERDFFAQVRYAPAVTLEVALGDPIVPRVVRIRVPPAEPGPLASLLLEPGRRGDRVPDGCAAARLVARPDWSRAHLDVSDHVIERALLHELARLYPLAAERVRFTRVARWPLALPCFEVGAYRALARFAHVQQDAAARGRRVYFAGDYLVGPRVEAAVASGFRAAAAVRADLGL